MVEKKKHIKITKSKRLEALDALRGVAVILMISTHIIISFFWYVDSIWIKGLSYIGGYISFTLFLLISGYIIGYLQEKLSLKKIAKKSLILILIYFVIGLIYTQLSDADIYDLFNSPIFLEEYLIPFAIFPFLALSFLKLIKRIPTIKKILMSQLGGLIIIFLGYCLTYLGKILAPTTTNFITSIFLGSVDFHTFPIISYAVVYSIGMWLGWSFKEESPKNYIIESLSMIMISIIVAFGALFSEKIYLDINLIDEIRWPPTLFFVASGLSVSLIILTFFQYVGHEWKKWYIPLPTIGKYALHIFVAHLLVIYSLQYYFVWRIPREYRVPVSTTGPIPTMMPQEQIFELLETPTYQSKWLFEQEKIALIETEKKYLGKNVAIDIDTQYSRVNSSLGGISIYNINGKNEVEKLQFRRKKLSSQNSYVSFTLPKDSTYIAVGFPLNQNSINVSNSSSIISGANTKPGNIIAKINKDFTNWVLKPYSIEGQTWYVRDKELITNNSYGYSLHLPINCTQKKQYEEILATTITIIDENGEVIGLGECKDIAIPDIAKKFNVNKSFSEINFILKEDVYKRKNGEHNISFKLNIPSPYIDTTLIVDIKKRIYISEPLYVIWSLDWEGFYVPQYSFDRINNIRDNTPGLKISHMFNPRIWNSTAVSSNNANQQINFVKNGHNKYKDEIALHLHMFKDLVTKSGVEPLTISGWSNRTDGYDIPTNEYSYEDLKEIFKYSVSEFKRIGLPAPITYRAGGWFASINVLKAAHDNGIWVDSSGRTSYSSASFGNGPRYDGPWNLRSNQQPYWISQSNINVAAAKSSSLGVFEIPNNGGDSWAFSTEGMIARFKSFSPQLPKNNVKIVTFLSHPEFMKTEGPKIQKVILETYMYSATADNGPVVYTTLSEFSKRYAK